MYQERWFDRAAEALAFMLTIYGKATNIHSAKRYGRWIVSFVLPN